MIWIILGLLLLLAVGPQFDPTRKVRHYYHTTDDHAMPTKQVYRSWLIRFLPFTPKYGMTLPGWRSGTVTFLFRKRLGDVFRRDVVHESSHGDTVIRLDLEGELPLRVVSWAGWQREHGEADEKKATAREVEYINRRPLPAPVIVLDHRINDDAPDILVQT